MTVENTNKALQSYMETVLNDPSRERGRELIIAGLQNVIAGVRDGSIVAVLDVHCYQDGSLGSSDFLINFGVMDEMARIAMASFLRMQTEAWMMERQTPESMSGKASERLRKEMGQPVETPETPEAGTP